MSNRERDLLVAVASILRSLAHERDTEDRLTRTASAVTRTIQERIGMEAFSRLIGEVQERMGR